MIDHWLQLNPILPTLLIFGLLLALGILFIWKEVQRKHRFFSFRIIAQVVMLISLAGILFRPAYRSASSSAIMLLTPNYNVRQADSVLRHNPSLKILHTSNAKSYNESAGLESYNGLAKHNNEIKFILGEGLPAYATEFLKNNDVTFLPANYPTGIVKLSLPKLIISKRKNTIEGVIHNASNNSILYLEGPGGKEDSITLTSKKVFPFSLTFTPKQSGEFIYNILLKDSTDHKDKHPLPITVEEEKSLRILFIQHYPTFETQYLKSFLAKQHQLLLRYQLSRNTYRYEYLNHNSQRVDLLTKEALASFDLLFIDSDALQRLSSVELTTLQQSIQSGLGIFLLFNENPSNIRKIKSFVPFDFKKVNSDTAQLLIDSKHVSLPVWPITLDTSPPVYPTLQNKQRIISAYTYNGMGKVGFHLAQETYSLYLQGDSLSYSKFWSSVIEQVAREEEKLYSLRILNSFPIYPEEQVSIEIIGADQPPTLLLDSIKVPVLEDLFIDGLWNTTVWISNPGWHTLLVKEDSSTLKFYISDKNEWSALAKANMINATKSLDDQASETINKTGTYFKPISPLVFYLAFLLSTGFIWAAPKL